MGKIERGTFLRWHYPVQVYGYHLSLRLQTPRVISTSYQMGSFFGNFQKNLLALVSLKRCEKIDLKFLQGKKMAARIPHFYHVSFFEKAHRFFSSSYAQKKARAYTESLLANLRQTPRSVEKLCLADRFIQQSCKSRAIGNVARAFDRALAPYRVQQNAQGLFTHPKNKIGFEKWRRYQMPEGSYIYDSECSDWVEKSFLLSQMKVRQVGMPAMTYQQEVGSSIWVDGEWMPWSVVKEKFEIIHAKKDREDFIWHKDKQTVYSYLPNRNGLQAHHPYLRDLRSASEVKPIQCLNDEELERVRQMGLQYESECPEAERTYVLQIVTSYVEGPNTNYHNEVVKKKHPYLRIIVGDDQMDGYEQGEVREWGYNWEKVPLTPFKSIRGRFRSPDKWNLVQRKESVVTNIAVTHDQAKSVLKFINKYHNQAAQLGKETGFHLAYQNCSVFIHEACKAAGIEIPVGIGKAALIAKCAPDWMKMIGRGVKRAADTLFYPLSLLPRKISVIFYGISALVKRIVEWVLSLSCFPVRVALGGLSGRGGVRFDGEHFEETRQEHHIRPPLRNPIRWGNFFTRPFFTPGVIQDWQRTLASTVVFENPREFAVVPPLNS